MYVRDYAWKNIAAGAIAGIAASWVMNRFQSLQSSAIGKIKQKRQTHPLEMKRPVPVNAPPAPYSEDPEAVREQNQISATQEPSTVKLAKVISLKVAHRELNDRQARIAEPIVHYTFGALMGAGYGALSEFAPVTTSGRGALYGTAVWLGADEIGLAAIGIAKNPLRYPVSTHLTSLSAHTVYGVTLDAFRRLILKLMGVSKKPMGTRRAA